MSLDQDRANAFIQRLVGEDKALKRKVPTRQEQVRKAAREQIKVRGNIPNETLEAGYPYNIHYIPSGSPASRSQRLQLLAENEHRRPRRMYHYDQNAMSRGGAYSNRGVPQRITFNTRIQPQLENDRSAGTEYLNAVHDRTARDVRDSKDYFKRTGQQRPEALKIQQQREHATIKPKQGK